MTYRAFQKNLNRRGMFRIRPDLGRIRKVLATLGHPQNRWPSIHIAGTNGKGSVAAALESVLRAGGYRTGLYTSPHLMDLRERIQVNGAPVTEEFCSIAEDVLRAERRAQSSLTYFELLTAIAFQSFARLKVDIGIIECGMGGLWDATNVLREPVASLITSIGLDHAEWLGRTESAIASQKAGIIKDRGYVISGARGPGRAAIARAAHSKHATLLQLDADFTAEGLTASLRSGKQTIRFRARGEAPEIIPFGLLGRYQVDNAALVMAAVRRLKALGWSIPALARDYGLSNVRWPGRFQIIRRCRSAEILLDGAHNPPAMKHFLHAVQSSAYRDVPKAFVFSAFKDKDYRSMAGMIMRLASEIYLCPLPGGRGASLSQLRRAYSSAPQPVHTAKNPKEALARALRATPHDALVVVTGSFALVGGILRAVTPAKAGDQSNELGSGFRRNDGGKTHAHV
jgi:dihydrofolate synthase/folylpolyglutamate synthase